MLRAFSTVIDGRPAPETKRYHHCRGWPDAWIDRASQLLGELIPLFVAVVLAAHVSDTHNTLAEWGTRLYLHSVCRPDRFLLGIVDADGVVQARDLEDALVVLGEPVGKEPLLLTVYADEQRDQEPDAATVHVL